MNRSILGKGKKFLVAAFIAAAIAAGCGGNSENQAVTNATITPYKGPYSSGTVALRDAHGNPVSLVAGGTINANGSAEVSYADGVIYPLVIEVTGSYYNEVTGITESATTSLRGIILDATAARSTVPVTIVTETAVADLVNRMGTFSPSNPITTVAAAASLSIASATFGIPASAVPVFNASTHETSDANTLQLAALAVVANGQVGATLVDRARALAEQLSTRGSNPATSVIIQAVYDNALNMVTSGPLSILADGATAPAPATISTSGVDELLAQYLPTGRAAIWDGIDSTWDNVDWQ